MGVSTQFFHSLCSKSYYNISAIHTQSPTASELSYPAQNRCIIGGFFSLYIYAFTICLDSVYDIKKYKEFEECSP